MTSTHSSLAVVALLALIAAPGGAQQTYAARVRGSPPAVDGLLDDPAWLEAPPLTDFLQRNPVEGAAASEATEVRFVYTDRALYVGIRAFDRTPERIVGRLVRRDQRVAADNVTIFIDSYYDRRTAFEFSVNPSGARRDVFIYDDGAGRDESWDPVYDWATAVDSVGWTAEWMIPFSQLRFARRDSLVFGLRVRRFILRRNEDLNWPFTPRDQAGEVSRYGDLIGLVGVPTPTRVEFLPYAAGSQRVEPAVADNPFATGRDASARVGGDAKLGITSGLTLDLTLNPDFGQVEADPAVVNLTAFETFFPEKRPFFVEGSNLFRFGLSGSDGDEGLVYTRRIGRSPQTSVTVPSGFVEPPTQTTILGAGKVSGHVGRGWAIGIAQALTAKEHTGFVDSLGVAGSAAVEPLTSYTVLRAQRTVGSGRLAYGAIATGVLRDLDEPRFQVLHRDAAAAGADLRWRFGGDAYEVQAAAMGSRVAGSEEALRLTQRSPARYYQRPDNSHTTLDSSRTSLWGFGASARVARVTGPLVWHARYDTRSPGFEVNDVGFLRVADRHQQQVGAVLRWLTPTRLFRSARLGVGEHAAFTYGGERTSTRVGVEAEVEFLNYWELQGGVERAFTVLDPRLLRGGPAVESPGGWAFQTSFRTDFRRPLWGRIEVGHAREDASGARRWEIGGGSGWRPGDRLSFNLFVRGGWGIDDRQFLAQRRAIDSTHHVLGRLDRRELSLSLRAAVSLSPRLSFELFAQPLVSAGRYQELKLAARPRAASYAARFDVLGPDRLTRRGDATIGVDADGNGTTDFTLAEPNFRLVSFRTSAVLRWEFRPGSTLFLVWQQDRSDQATAAQDASLVLSDALGDSFSATGRHTLAIKVAYWIGL